MSAVDSVRPQLKRPASDLLDTESVTLKTASKRPKMDFESVSMKTTSKRSKMDNIYNTGWGPKTIATEPEMDIKCKAEYGRLLEERTFLLTLSASKYIVTGLDPLGFNEPRLYIRHRVYSGYIGFDTKSFEDFLFCLPKLLDSIEDVPEEQDEDPYKVIMQLNSYDVLLLPHKVVKFRNNSYPTSAYHSMCLALDTLKVFTRMGNHFLKQLHELQGRKALFPMMEYFAADVATKVVRENGGVLSDDCAWAVIKDIYNDDFNAHDLYTRFYHHMRREITRIVDHMQTYNNDNYFC